MLSSEELKAMRDVDMRKMYIDDPDWTTKRAIALLDKVEKLEKENALLKEKLKEALLHKVGPRQRNVEPLEG